MEQVGRVLEIKEGKALVQITRATACYDNCAHCGGCQSTSLTVLAENNISAKTGQMVKIEMTAQRVIFAAFMIYIMPLIVLFSSYIGFYSLSNNQIQSGFFAGILFFVSYFVLKKIDERAAKSGKFKIVISKIIE